MSNEIGNIEKNGLDFLANVVKNCATATNNAGTPNSYDFRIPAWIKGLGTMLKKNPKMANIVFAVTIGASGALVLTGFIIGRKTVKIDLEKLSDKKIAEIKEKLADEIDKENKE